MSLLYMIFSYLLVFFCGIATHVFLSSFLRKEESGLITFEKKEVLIARGSYWISLMLVLFGFFYVAGPGGWIYEDFLHYQTQVVCIPNYWQATFYPDPAYREYYIQYSNTSVKIYTPDDINKTMLTEQDIMDIFNQSNKVPKKPGDANKIIG